MAADAGRVLRWALAVILGLEIAYLFAANLVLSVFVPRWVNAEPKDSTVRYESAFSPWPGRVWIRNFEMRLQDSHIQFLLKLGRASIEIDLPALASRTFRATPVAVSGVQFRFRHKIRDLAGDELRVPALPPIPGFSDPPLVTPSEPPGEKLWTIELGSVDAELEELWIQEYRYVGRARVRGGFRLVPRKRFRVDPSRLELSPGRLYVGASELLSPRFAGTISARIEENEIVRYPGARVLEKLSTRIDLSADIKSLDFARLYLAPRTRVKLGKGEGKSVAKIVVERGRLEPPTRVTYETNELSFQLSPLAVIGDATVITEVNAEHVTRLSASGKNLRVSNQKARQSVAEARVEGAELGLEAKDFALHEPLRITGGDASVGELIVPDLRLMNALLEEPVQVEGGAARASGRARLTEDSALSGNARVNFESARIRRRDVRVTATGTLRGSFREPNVLDGGRGAYERASLVLQEFELGTSRGRSGIGRLRFDADTIPFKGFEPVQISGRVRTSFPHARPLLKALDIEPTGVPKLAMSLLDLSDLSLVARGYWRRDSQGIWLDQARTDALSARGAWQKKRSLERGAFLLATNVAKVGIELSNGGAHLDLFASERWLEQKLSELDLGTLSANRDADRAP